MAESSQADFISWENLIYVVDFLQAGGEKRISVLGGEPTLHPDFQGMIRYLLERNFSVTIFTSGIIPANKLDQTFELLDDIPAERCSFVCNLNDPDKTPQSRNELESVRRFLDYFGPRTVAGFNIYRVDFGLEFLLQYICQYGMRRSIRLGLAHPIPGKANLHIALHELDAIIARLMSYQELFERLRIHPGLDCGFPMCRFTDQQIGQLHRSAGWQFSFTCGPVVDIGPDLAVWPCFPLSSFHRKSLYEFNNLAEVIDYHRNFHRVVRIEQGGIFDECDTCRNREDGVCNGGCAGHAVARFQDEEPLRLREIYI